MRALARLRPSPAMVVALLALFVALGGVSYAVATIDSSDIVNGSIRGRDVKNKGLTGDDVKDKSLKGGKVATNTLDARTLKTGAVTSTDINNGAVGSVDVNNDALTGVDINESTLGTVPLATAAESATSAQNAATVSTVTTIPVTTVVEGGAIATLASYGPFVIQGSCTDAAGATRAEVTIDTTANDTNVQGETDADSDFDAADPPQRLTSIDDALVAPGTSTAYNEGVFTAFASATGRAITGNIASWAQAAAAGQCKFHGSVVISG